MLNSMGRNKTKTKQNINCSKAQTVDIQLNLLHKLGGVQNKTLQVKQGEMVRNH